MTMQKDDIIRKLSSRKLWATIAVIVLSIASYLGADGNEIVEVASLVSALLSGAVYNICESRVDVAREYAKVAVGESKPTDKVGF